jgi:hypothetical protein
MFGVQTSAGSKLKVSASLPATNNASGFDALTFTEVGEITDLGEFGREYNMVTHSPLSKRQTVQMKGSYTEGTMDLTLGLDDTDAGQIIMRSASESDADYAFEVTYQNGAKRFFTAKVMSFKENVGGVDSVTGATCSLALQTQIIRVAAA